MAYFNQDWEKLGRNIQDIVDEAVSSRDFSKLNQNIRSTVERVVDAGTDAVKRAADPAAYRKSQIVEERKDLPVLYGNPNGKLTVGIIKIVGGGLLAALVLAGSIVSVVLEFVMGISAGVMGGVLALGGIAGGTGLIASGIHNVSWVSRFKKYRKTLGQKTYCTLEKLAKSVGKSVSFVRKELRQMIDSGLFLEGHLDNEQTRLITSHETYRNFEQARFQLEERQRLEAEAKQAEQKLNISPQVQDVLDRGNAFISEIRRCNDLIPGEEISAKIDRMETIVRRIFDRAKTNPEIVPDLKKLMDYYLPMTVKLLNAYADMDAQPIQGETIRASKREIEETLDTLNLAFEKLLDDLFADTALDISSDISVLQTLLAQEGLTEDAFSKMNKKNTSYRQEHEYGN